MTPNWETRYDRSRREWGTYAARRLAYLVNCPASPDHGERHVIEPGFYTGGGPARKHADEWTARLNAKETYVPIDQKGSET